MKEKGNYPDAANPKIKEIMRKKKLAKWMSRCGYALVGVSFVILLIIMTWARNTPFLVGILPIMIAMALLFGGDALQKKVLLAQKELKIEKMPDEIEAERKNNERIQQLVASPEDMDREFKRLATWNKILSKMFMLGLLFLGVDAVMTIIISAFDIAYSTAFIVTMVCVTIILLFPTAFLYDRVDKRQKRLSIQYTPGVLSEIMDRLDRYDYTGSVDQKYMWEDFAFGSRDRIGKCGDYVKGVLRGMPVEFCEFEIQYEATTTDSDGRRKKEIRTSFSGLMAVCQHGFKLNKNVTMTQFSRYSREIKTESVEFTRAWSIKEDSGQDAFLVLTPQYMEKLMATIREKQMRMGLQFRTDGVLLIVLKGANFFEVDEADQVTVLKDKIRNEMKDLADIMEYVGALSHEESD